MTNLRIFKKQQAYHIVTRCHNQKHLIANEYYKKFWLAQVRLLVKEFKVKVLNFVIMDNHYHLILIEEEKNHVTFFMRRLNANITRVYNKENAMRGTLWDGRYRSFEIKEPYHFFESLLYLDFNPVRVGVIDDPRDYEYSGCQVLCTKEDHPIIDIATVGQYLKSCGFNFKFYENWVESKMEKMDWIKDPFLYL